MSEGQPGVLVEICEVRDTESGRQLEPLKLRPRDPEPSLLLAGVQTGLALAVIFMASRIFVSQLEIIGLRLGAPPQLAALLLSPIATEMPETMNAIIWVRQRPHGTCAFPV